MKSRLEKLFGAIHIIQMMLWSITLYGQTFRMVVLLSLLVALPSSQGLVFEGHRIAINYEHSNHYENSTSASTWSKSTAWELPFMKGMMKGQLLHVRKIEDHPNKWHTCYEVFCENTWKNHCPAADAPEATLDFCLPAVVVTGLPKSGTSATYDLLSRYSGSIKMFDKENCPYTRRRSHWEYFHTLPRAADVKPGMLVIDACLDTQKNLMLRRVMYEPKTLYVIMTRNYADLVWSSYNFWCQRDYDGPEHCDNTRWVKLGVHNRSADSLHEMIVKDKANKLNFHDTPFHDSLVRPCENAGMFVENYLKTLLWNDQAGGGKYTTRGTDPEHTLVIASEVLEINPLSVWQKISNYFNMITSHINGSNNLNNFEFQLGNFSDFRANTQDNKGTQAHTSIASYKPGLFAISGYKPLRDDTREILNECWKTDCIFVSEISGFQYPACS